jgi:threonyl-tRNA synthetase
MIHRAPLGSPERFIGILIEHFGGAFPLWLAPVQVAVLPVSEKFSEYAAKVADTARAAGLRVRMDETADKVGAKIRRWTVQKVPYLFIVGGREADSGTVAVRCRKVGDVGALGLNEAVDKLKAERDGRALESAIAAAAE